jgi:hypothetical protein
MILDVKEKLIYVAHPYGGDRKNKNKVQRIIEDLVNEYPQYCFVSPIHCFGFMYDLMDYEEGMHHCFSLLDQCTEIWIYGDSQGTRLEREYAQMYNIPIREMV